MSRALIYSSCPPAAARTHAAADDKITSVDTTRGALYGDSEPFVRKAEKIGQAGKLSRETVIGARPDIIIGALSNLNIDDLAAAGIPTLVTSSYCEDRGLKPESARRSS